jgi:hypothetical protein
MGKQPPLPGSRAKDVMCKRWDTPVTSRQQLNCSARLRSLLYDYQVLAAHPHLRLKRLPSYSPQLNVIERFWRVLRRRATHNRLFASRAVLRTTLRNNLCYFQTMRQKVLSLIASPRRRKKEAKLAAA